MARSQNKAVEKSLRKKAKESGIALSTLRKVFERGEAAWLTGSRPGVGMTQWAMARVNSFIKGSRKHDRDLR